MDPAKRPVRIIVVGDRETLELIRGSLSGWDRAFTLEFSDSPDEALASLRHEAFDVLILSEVLSGADRLPLIRDARALCGDLCIVSMRGAEDRTPAPADIAAGADDIVRSPAPFCWVMLPVMLDRRIESLDWRRRYDQIRQRYVEIVQNMPAIIATVTADGVVAFAAGRTEEMLGAPPEQLIGRRLGSLTGPQDSTPQLLSALREVAETGRRASLTLPRRHPDGQVIWWRISLSAVADRPGGDVIAVGQDITEQIRARDEARRRTEELDCLYAVTRDLHGVLDPREALKTAASAIQSTFLADAVAILLLSEDSRQVRDIASSGFSEQFSEVADRTMPLIFEDGLFGHAIRAGRAVVATDENLAQLTLHTELLRDQGLTNAVCVPVVIRSYIAALLLVMRRERPYDRREVELVESLAARIATTAEMAGAHSELKRAFEAGNRLLEVSAAINAQRRLREVLRAICDAAASTSDALSAALAVAGPGSGVFSTTCVSGTSRRQARSEDAADGLIRRGLTTTAPFVVTRDGPDWPDDAATSDDEAVRSAVVIPLLFGGLPLGVLSVRRSGRDDPGDQDRLALELLASKAALAIRNHALLSEARRSGRLYRDLFELSGIPMIVYNRDGVIEMVNREFERLSGYDRDELLGRLTIFDLMDEDERERDMPLHHAYWAGNHDLPPVRELKARTRDGGVHFIEAVLHRMPGRDSITAVLIDRTEPLELQRQLIQSEKAAALGQLVSGVAHELNNPLTTILGYAQLLQDHDDREVAEEAALIEHEARRSQKVIEGLLSFARERTVQSIPTEVNDAVREAVGIPRYALAVDNIALEMDLAEDLPVTSADPHQLVQVFLNIINNAHYAMRRAGGRLAITTRAVDDVIEVQIADTGPGMTEAEARRAFDPFFTTKDVNEGTGMGLSVSEGIIRRHEGSIELQTAPGEGATFTIRLPVRTTEPPTPAPVVPQTAQVVPVRVLVVDDERPLLDLVRKALTALGHSVDAATNADDALARLETNSYDLVLSDLRMPGMNGETFRTRVIERWPELAERFVLMTGDTMAVETHELLKRPDVRVMRKPFTLEQLRALVNTVGARASE